MTANELADYITVNEIRTVTIDMVANMLRQQQALIEQFEKTQDYLYKTHDADKAEIEALKAKMSLSSYDDAQNVVYQLLNEKISLWDYFAANALQGLISGCYSGNNVGFTVEGNVFAAYEYADAMMKASKK
ncbi:MAG: hypothetical protein D0531_01245 [Methylococcales bacterium]|nr:MAG: hypothetical protein D0531_01245 [Methylococcales bacterium]